MYLLSSLQQSHYYLAKALQPGHLAVDATAGNGHDTIFLARLVAPHGKVYSIDIQEKALARTRKLLAQEGCQHLVKTIRGNHADLAQLVEEKVQAVVFNLGYLPGGNHSITTKPAYTIAAVQGALQIVNPGGLILIVAYHGHEDGKTEVKELSKFLMGINQKKVTVAKYEFINQINYPPILFALEVAKS